MSPGFVICSPSVSFDPRFREVVGWGRETSEHTEGKGGTRTGGDSSKQLVHVGTESSNDQGSRSRRAVEDVRHLSLFEGEEEEQVERTMGQRRRERTRE